MVPKVTITPIYCPLRAGFFMDFVRTILVLSLLNSAHAGILLGGAGSEAGDTSWQLPAANFVSTDVTGMLPVIVGPRPDVERYDYDHYSYAYPGILNEYPLFIQGGSYPFRCEITATSGTADTSGIAMGAETLTETAGIYTRPDGYCVVRYTPDVGDDGNTFGYTARVTDQDGNTTTVTVNGTVQASQYIFYDSTDAGSLETGTITEPYNDWQSAFGSTSTATTNTQKLAIFRAGDHPLTGYAGSSNNYTIGAEKVRAYIGYPGETVGIDLGTGFFNLNGYDDFYFAGINFNDNDTSDAKGRMFFASNDVDRTYWYDNTFTDYFVGTACAQDNCAVIYYPNAGGQYFGLLSNTINGEAGTMFQAFEVTDGVVEDTTYGGTANQTESDESSHAVIWLKDGPTRVSVRANHLYGATWTNTDLALAGAGGQDGWQDVEFCWNKFEHPSEAMDNARLNVGTYTEYQDVYYYRNSLEGNVNWLKGGPTGGVFIYNVVDGTIDNDIDGTAGSGTAQSGAAGSITLASGESSVSQRYRNMLVDITSGTGSGQQRRGTSYDGSTKVLSVTPNWTVVPDNTSQYSITTDFTDVSNNGESVTGAFDSSMDLTGSARTTYLCTHGAEVATGC